MFPLAGRLQPWHLEPLNSVPQLFIYAVLDAAQTPHAEIFLQSFDLSARLNRDKETGNDRIETSFGDLGRKKESKKKK